ncbi:hypothetical protein KAH51_19825, partial [Proteus vulgaris]|uniref:O-antigen ligase family protein n=1 Tax=Proteus vulgaris TaxID=585 RepID=UPI001B4563BC|nr:hypothetical protein [Proteus vulgaris]
LSLNIYIKNRFKVNNNKNKYILLILIVLTFSRSAIVASLILIIISNNIYKLKFRSYLLLLIITLVFIFMSLSYIFSDSNYQFIDGSLNSKFYIVEKAFIIYSEIPIENKLFGIGLGNTELFLNIFAHNILVTMLLEFGLIGSFLFILFIIYSLISSNHFCLLIWIPILIAGISLFGAYAPYLFIINAIIYFEESVNSNLK